MLWRGASSIRMVPPAPSSLAASPLSHPLHRMALHIKKGSCSFGQLLGNEQRYLQPQVCATEIWKDRHGAYGGSASGFLKSAGSVSARHAVSCCPSAGGQYATASSPPGASDASQPSSTWMHAQPCFGEDPTSWPSMMLHAVHPISRSVSVRQELKGQRIGCKIPPDWAPAFAEGRSRRGLTLEAVLGWQDCRHHPRMPSHAACVARAGCWILSTSDRSLRAAARAVFYGHALKHRDISVAVGGCQSEHTHLSRRSGDDAMRALATSTMPAARSMPTILLSPGSTSANMRSSTPGPQAGTMTSPSGKPLASSAPTSSSSQG